MNLSAASLALLAAGCLTAGFLLGAVHVAAILSGVFGALWAAVLTWCPGMPVHGLFLCVTLGAAGLLAVQGHPILALGAGTAALFAWDVASVRRMLVVLPPATKRRIAPYYLTQAAITAAAAVAVPLLAVAVRPALSFPVAFGLLLGILALLGLSMWQSARVARGSGHDGPEAQEPSSKREASGPSARSAGRSPRRS